MKPAFPTGNTGAYLELQELDPTVTVEQPNHDHAGDQGADMGTIGRWRQ